MLVSTDLTPNEIPLHHKESSHLHLNGQVIYIKSLNMYLTIAHHHYNLLGGRTKFGNTYMSYFILFEAEEPWRIQYTSPAWCFASIDSSSGTSTTCDTIQFIMSTFQKADDDDALVISYGVNDCDGAVAEMSLQKVLDFTQSLKVHTGI